MNLHQSDINPVISDLQHLLRRMLAEEIDLQIHGMDGPLKVQADGVNVGQVLVNLGLSNP